MSHVQGFLHATGLRAVLGIEVESLDALGRADADGSKISSQEQVRDRDGLLVEHEKQAWRAVPVPKLVEKGLEPGPVVIGDAFCRQLLLQKRAIGTDDGPARRNAVLAALCELVPTGQ